MVVGRHVFIQAWVAIGGWFSLTWGRGPPWVGGFVRRRVMGFGRRGPPWVLCV